MKQFTRWILAAGILVSMATLAPAAALITQGSNEIEVAGELDFDTEIGTRFLLELNYAYFFWDRIALGGRGSVFRNDAVTEWSVGGTAEYNFSLPEGWLPLLGTDLVPFVGGAVDLRYVELFDISETAVVFSGEGGVKFFLTDTTAVALSLVGEWATEEIYADDKEPTDLNLFVKAGMRFYF